MSGMLVVTRTDHDVHGAVQQALGAVQGCTRMGVQGGVLGVVYMAPAPGPGPWLILIRPWPHSHPSMASFSSVRGPTVPVRGPTVPVRGPTVPVRARRPSHSPSPVMPVSQESLTSGVWSQGTWILEISCS